MERVTRLHRIRKTCLQMLKERGYLVPRDELEMTNDQFVERFTESVSREDLTILVPRQDDPTKQVFVFFPDEEKIGVKTVEQIAQRMKAEDVMHAIMVIPGTITPFAKTAVGGLGAAGFSIEQFTDAELLVNILQHVLVPEHRVLTDVEKKILLDRYKVSDTQLPRIQMSDPIARFFGLQRGQVVRIVRPSETAGRYVTYRMCV